MADNILTGLAPVLFKKADTVGREQVGFLSSVLINKGSEAVAQGDTIRSFKTIAPILNTTYTPSMVIPEGDGQTIDSTYLTINKAANVQIPWTGEQKQSLNNGAGWDAVFGDQFLQAMRAISNKIETDIGAALDAAASRAYGTAGTTPFATNFNEIANLRQILVDNGTPMDGNVTMVLNTSAGTNLRNLSNLQGQYNNVNDELLRQGTLLDLQGIKLKESAGVATHTKGTGTGYLVNNTGGYPIGTTQIAVDTGTGTIVAGDIVTFAADTINKYVVESFDGTILTIGPTGLRVAIPDNNVITIGNSHTSNMVFHQSAVELAVRAPMEAPVNGAVDSMVIQDPFTGLTFRVEAFGGRGKSMFDITALYGIKVWKPDFVAKLMG